MDGVLRAERVWVETFTGLRGDQFGRLLKAVRERGGDGCGWGRSGGFRRPGGGCRVVVYHRADLTVRQLAPLSGVSPVTVCRVIQRLGPPLGARADTGPAGCGRAVVDRGRRPRPVVATAGPAPGATADAEARWDSGPAGHCQGVTVLGDGAYINTGLVACRIADAPNGHCSRPRKKATRSTARSAPASSTSSPA
ncbi:IS5/IS1182 family transposase [Streptomyces hirsutus]